MRDHVERDLLCELARRLVVGGVVHRLGLVPQLVNALFARTGYRLVGADNNAFDPRAVVQRLQRHDHLRGRTVGVGDDLALDGQLDVLGVHFGDDQRDVGIVAIKRRVINDIAARFGGDGRVFLGGVRPDGKQRNVPTREIERIEILRLECLVAKADLRAQRFAAGQSGDFIHRKLALCQDVQHFVAHVSSGANDDDAITHCDSPFLGARRPYTAWSPVERGTQSSFQAVLSRENT